MAYKYGAFTSDGFTIEASVSRILDDYSKETLEKTTKIFDDVAKETAQKLRNTSPRGKGKNAGEYARSWTVKKERDKNGLQTLTVHNAKHYQLTHLLEWGHALPQGGRYEPKQKHIEPVEEWSKEEITRRLEEL